MVHTMRVFAVLALCLCFVAPSPALSFTLPDEKFADHKMTELEEEPTDPNLDSIAKSLIRSVFGEAEEDDVEDEIDVDQEMAKRGPASRTGRSFRVRGNQRPKDTKGFTGSPIVSRSKFSFGKRVPNAEQLLGELDKEDVAESMRIGEKLALLEEEALFDNRQDNHQVQKDAYAAFPFGKRGMSALFFGKRARPSFYFGKRGVPSFLFGKRRPSGSAFLFGRRDWAPEDSNPDQMGPYEIERNLAFTFGNRDSQ